MTKLFELDRRQFAFTTAALCGGLAVGLRWPALGLRQAHAQARSIEITPWVVIAPDNTVTIRIAQQEMGQGTTTSLSQLIAEEAEFDWATIRYEFFDIVRHLAQNRVYGSRIATNASSGIKQSEQVLFQAGATIRTLMVKAAAQRLNVPEAELVAENSAVTHKASGRKLTYGELAPTAATLPPPDPKTLKLKTPAEWKIVGKSMKRFEVPAKVNGTAIFGIDVKLPGMKHAAIMSSPVFGGKLKSYDASAALSRPGVVKVVEIKGGQAGGVNGMDDGIAVVADHWWQAKTALDAMPKEWDGGDNPKKGSADYLNDMRAAMADVVEKPIRKEGDAEAAMKSAAKVLTAEYSVPFLDHATMEPMTCAAIVTDDGFEVWAPTQGPEQTINVAARMAGFPIEKGRINIVLLGGGFGRRSLQDYTSQTVQIAKVMKGTPIKMISTREETTRHGFYRQASLSKVQGGLDASGKPIAWSQRIVGSAPNFLTTGSELEWYTIPNILVDSALRPSPVPLGNFRSVGNGHTCFFHQSFFHELAHAAGKDAYTFQRALMMDNDRGRQMVAVFDAAAQKSDWGKPLGPNRGRGIALDYKVNANTAMATVVEVTLDSDGWFKVDRVVCAADTGWVVNPDNAIYQVEGSVAYGLTAALYGEISISNGRAVEGNFDDYQMMRIGEMPKVDVHLVPSGKVWGGIGEGATASVQTATVNAIFDAGGPRIRSLPLKNHDISKRPI